MTVPTEEEIAQALDEIDRRGTGASETLALAMIPVKNQRVQSSLRRIAAGPLNHAVEANQTELGMAALAGAYLAGLNLGLTIQAQRRSPVSDLNEALAASLKAAQAKAQTDRGRETG